LQKSKFLRHPGLSTGSRNVLTCGLLQTTRITTSTGNKRRNELKLAEAKMMGMVVAKLDIIVYLHVM